MKHLHRPLPPPARGIALLIALVILATMSLLGLAGLRSVTLEQKMATGTYDRSLAFQAAETALLYGESVIPHSVLAGQIPDDLATGNYTNDTCEISTCNSGLCARPDPVCTERWLDASFTGWVAGPTVQPPNKPDLMITTQYFVEVAERGVPCTAFVRQDIQSLCNVYRVTARNVAGEGRGSVMLQSTFRWPN